MIDFRRIREAVSAQDAARRYGAEFDRRGWAICPFHGDRHPSVSFRGGRFKCFSCGVSGDAIDYTAQLFQLRDVEAAQKLDADFHLGLGQDNPGTCKEEERRRVQADAHTAFEDWRAGFMARLNRVCFISNGAVAVGPPWTEQQGLAIRYHARAEYISDTLEDGTPEQQAQIFRERGRTDKWIEQILRG